MKAKLKGPDGEQVEIGLLTPEQILLWNILQAVNELRATLAPDMQEISAPVPDNPAPAEEKKKKGKKWQEHH